MLLSISNDYLTDFHVAREQTACWSRLVNDFTILPNDLTRYNGVNKHTYTDARSALFLTIGESQIIDSGQYLSGIITVMATSPVRKFSPEPAGEWRAGGIS
jgi:hypothetical protein